MNERPMRETIYEHEDGTPYFIRVGKPLPDGTVVWEVWEPATDDHTLFMETEAGRMGKIGSKHVPDRITALDKFSPERAREYTEWILNEQRRGREIAVRVFPEVRLPAKEELQAKWEANRAADDARIAKERAKVDPAPHEPRATLFDEEEVPVVHEGF